MTAEGAGWKSALLGVVQGVTEFLPVSSSGHLLALKEALALEAPLSFDVALHLATLAAVLIYFRGDLLGLVAHPRRWRVLALVLLATVPGAALGYLLGGWRERIDPWWAVGGWTFSAAYLILSRRRAGAMPYAGLSLRRGLLVGMAQALAICPGVSRSGSSIVAGLWLGLDRDAAFRFSFLIAIPIIAGAGLKKGLELGAADLEGIGGWGPLAAGMACAFAVGLVAIHFLLQAVRGDRLHLFGFYNAAAAVLFALFLVLRG